MKFKTLHDWKIFYSIFGLLLSVCIVGCNQQPAQNRSSEKSAPHPLLLISFDGFKNEYIERNETPNFDRFIENGVKAEYLVPIFPSKTFPNHYTIVTGLYAEHHGIIANSFYDDSLNARFSYGPVDSPNDERWWGGEPIWITAEKQGLTATTYFWPGSEASIDGIHPTKWVQFDDSVPERTRIDSVTAWLDPNGSVHADFGALYFSLVDHNGHEYGPNSTEVNESVQKADSLVGYLYSKTEEHGLSDILNVIIVSDHGMAELSDDKLIFLDELINLDDVKMIDWTPVAMIHPKEGKMNEIYSSLKEHENNYRVYLKEELPERYHFSAHYRIPEIIMIADVGYTITSKDFYEKNGIDKGDHGYNNSAPEMRTFFAAHGPYFKSGEVVSPFQSVHIYELMCELLNLEPAKNDGDFEEVRQLLR